jgi:hypothetical protein
MCFVNPGEKAMLPSRSRSRLLLEGRKEQCKEQLKRQQVRVHSVPRPLVDALTQHVEDVSERFAVSLHFTLSIAFDDVPPSSASLVLVNGKPTADYVAAIDYRRIVHSLLRFKCCHPQDLTSLFVLTLVYLRQMKSRSALPLLEQMIAWFDVSNCVYCIAFLAHVWLFDEALPLQDWHGIAEGVVKGVNLNKCVRNCLRILKYRLYPNAKEVRCATLALEYQDKPRATVDITGLDPEALIRAKSNPPIPREEEPRRSRSTARYSELSRHRAASRPSEPGRRAPFAPSRRVS